MAAFGLGAKDAKTQRSQRTLLDSYILLAGLLASCHHAPPAVVVFTPRDAVEDSTIRGIVISDDRRVRVAQARLFLDSTTSRIESGADGRFFIEHVTPGRHVLHVYAITYHPLEQVVQMPAGRGAAIVVLLAPWLTCHDECPKQKQRTSRVENVP